MKQYFIECMLFQKGRTNYGFAPNWMFGVYGWINLFIIIMGLLSIFHIK